MLTYIMCLEIKHYIYYIDFHLTILYFCILFSVFNDGNRKELLILQGTIPVTFKGTSILIN